MFNKLTRRVLTGVVAAAGLTAVLAAPASAAEPAGTASANTTSSVACSNTPGHYCVVMTTQSVSGGVNLKASHSTGYTTAAGHGKEWIVYTCNGSTGLCAKFGTNTVTWGGRDVKLVAQHVGLNFFLPCGAQVGAAWLINTAPKTLAPGHPGNGQLQFRVTCSGSRNTVAQVS